MIGCDGLYVRGYKLQMIRTARWNKERGSINDAQEMRRVREEPGTYV